MNNQGGQKSGDHVLNIYHDSRHLVLPEGHTSQTGKSAVSSLHKSTTTEPAVKLRSQEPMVEASVPRPAAVPRSIKQPMALPPVKLPTPNGAIMNSRGSASNPTITFTSDNRGAGSLNHNVQPVTTDLPQNSQYADTHMATSHTERLNRAMTPEIKQAAHRIAVRQAEASAIAEAQRRYHTAWQQYYQKYYESYYVAALQQQYKKFAQQKASVVDQKEPDGKLDQNEVQAALRKEITDKVKASTTKLRKRIWFWPAFAGLVALLVVAFLQFNGQWMASLASFVSPGTSSNQTIIIGTGEGQPVSTEPRVIIPKINVNAPVTYGMTDLSEQSSQRALQNGPIHYPIASANADAIPGQKGNTVILGHSSADFFEPGNYKFVFVQLNRMTNGDLFYLDYGGKRYTYKVAQIKVISPTQLDRLNLGSDKPYATLITCDPPGTTRNRLLVIGEQVYPDPNDSGTEINSDNVQVKTAATSITGKPKTLLEKIFGF